MGGCESAHLTRRSPDPDITCEGPQAKEHLGTLASLERLGPVQQPVRLGFRILMTASYGATGLLLAMADFADRNMKNHTTSAIAVIGR